MIKAWLEDRYSSIGYESWKTFQEHVQAGFAALQQHDPQKTIAVFTSATPIAIAAGIALQLTSEKILGLAWVMYNSGTTTIKMRDSAPHLYNSMPPLTC
ncbi:MAG: histidine phosphatase family protein [Blastocatellia bacterium]|nr:histidine phosphatase family protein [Blastocatellia bacterium]